MVKQPGKLDMNGMGAEKTADHLNLSGSDWTDIGTTIAGGVGGYLSSQNQTEAEKAKAAAAVQIAQLQLQQAQANAAAAAAAANGTSTKPGLSTGAIIGIAAGAVVLIGVVVVIAVKK